MSQHARDDGVHPVGWGRGPAAPRSLIRLPRRLTGSGLWAPLLVLVVMLAVWQGGLLHAVFGFPTFAVPYPDSIASSLMANASRMASAASQTIPAALTGYATGMGLGFLIASLLVRYAPAKATGFLPMLTATNSVPIVAVAPLVAFWVGGGFALKVFVVTVMVTPTMAAYATRGMTNVNPDALELYASYEATPGQVYRYLRVPSSIPFVFTALKSAIVLALIGTIVSEVVRGWDGLGFMITQAMSAFRASEGWLALIAIAAIGITWYLVVEALERALVPWDEANRRRE